MSNRLEALNEAVRSNSVDAVIRLADQEAPVAALRHSTVAHNVSVPLLEALTSRGYDFEQEVDRQDMAEGGMTLIYYPNVLKNEEAVRWLVEHGARLDRGETSYRITPQPPTLLEQAVMYASLPTIQLLHSKGAKVGRRTLHLAVAMAATVKADPSAPDDWAGYDLTKKSADTRKRMGEVLPYLVDTMGLDVNADDFEGERRPPGHYGTPLRYAAEQGATKLINWLISKGADPRQVD
ncbi:ankyrin repeat-containing domain protein [Stachybotrys elegans]|uniref:Ankyrin repeat-containing domain protein n=1 Tax=Stachybotrys elegans TaxID=80388 RepID=A0A8K0WMI8_9HYPO|nr:ankyrin repeat-containing domain protein [Stachybotrys elegans]